MAVERKAKGKGIVEFLGEIFNAWAKYLEANLKGLFIDMLKLSALETGAWVAGAIIISIAALVALYPTVAAASSGSEMLATALGNPYIWAVAALAVLVILIVSAVAITLDSVRYNAVHERARGKGVSIVPHAKANAVPIILFNLLRAVISLAVILPGVIVLFIVPYLNNSNIVFFLAMALLLLAILALIAFIFFIQFGWWELIIGKKGPVEAMKGSFALIRNGNILKTLAFDFCVILIVLALGFVTIVFNFALQLVLGVLLSVPIAGFIIYITACMLVSLVEGALTGALFIPLTYLFWNKLKG